MLTGSIIFFKEDRGYGFISSKNSDDNVYVHISELKTAGIEKVEIGQRLSYELVSQEGKNSATNIKLLD